MILVATIGTAALAILLSELLGSGKVVYTRLLALVGSFVLACAAAAVAVWRLGGTVWDVAAIVLSAIPFMAAWLGFRIHLSNSVTLEMVTLLEATGPRRAEAIVEAYDPHGHADRRLQILREAGYLVGANDEVAATTKGRAVLLLMRVVCGPAGPRAVAAMLDRTGAAR